MACQLVSTGSYYGTCFSFRFASWLVPPPVLLLLLIHWNLLLCLFVICCTVQHCRQPMEFLSFFREDASSESVGVEVMPAGAYVLPTFCEYCHAANVAQCPAGPTCRRPRLYFQKKRPPFCPPDATLWDATTDHAHPPPQVESPATVGQASWLSMFSSSEGD
jgi:hypothetical protein